jgi:hypothetical protein
MYFKAPCLIESKIEIEIGTFCAGYPVLATLSWLSYTGSMLIFWLSYSLIYNVQKFEELCSYFDRFILCGSLIFQLMIIIFYPRTDACVQR